jgi:hypothetical protein
MAILIVRDQAEEVDTVTPDRLEILDLQVILVILDHMAIPVTQVVMVPQARLGPLAILDLQATPGIPDHMAI